MKKYNKIILLFFLITTVVLLSGCEEYAEKATEDLIGESGDSGDSHFDVTVCPKVSVVDDSGNPVPNTDVRFDFIGCGGRTFTLYGVTSEYGEATAELECNMYAHQDIMVEVSLPGSGFYSQANTLEYGLVAYKLGDIDAGGSYAWNPSFVFTVPAEQ